MCTVLNDYFLLVFTKENVESILIQKQKFQETDMNLKQIKPDMVLNEIRGIKHCKKSDEIHLRLLKELSFAIAASLAQLFQSSLEQGGIELQVNVNVCQRMARDLLG